MRMRKLASLLFVGLWLGCGSDGTDPSGGTPDGGPGACMASAALTCSPPPHPQETYTYPGCANEDDHCPRLKTVHCALERLRTERDDCQQDSDCVAVTVNGRCTGYGECPPAMVNTAGREEFATRAAEEVLRYCTESPSCSSIGQCAFPSFVPRCRQGHCVAEPADAGP
ncbi:hypothetical protein [Corallococcus macrosporus]|nr:hypothetical protein [Corallococcus macrosporus]